MRPVGDPFASWQWNTRLGGGGAVALIGDAIIGSCSRPFCGRTGTLPFVGELAFEGFLLNNGILSIHWNCTTPICLSFFLCELVLFFSRRVSLTQKISSKSSLGIKSTVLLIEAFRPFVMRLTFISLQIFPLFFHRSLLHMINELGQRGWIGSALHDEITFPFSFSSSKSEPHDTMCTNDSSSIKSRMVSGDLRKEKWAANENERKIFNGTEQRIWKSENYRARPTELVDVSLATDSEELNEHAEQSGM